MTIEAITAREMVNTAIDVYAHAVDVYSASIAELSVTGKAKAAVDFDAIRAAFADGSAAPGSYRGFTVLEPDHTLGQQTVELSMAVKAFESSVEIKQRLGNLYSLAISGRK